MHIRQWKTIYDILILSTFFILFIACVYHDIKRSIIPVIPICIMVLTALAYRITKTDTVMTIASSLIIASVLFIIKVLSGKREGIGNGDICLIAAINIMFGYEIIIDCLFISCIMVLFFWFLSKIYKSAVFSKKMIPYSPFLLLGLIFSLILEVL